MKFSKMLILLPISPAILKNSSAALLPAFFFFFFSLSLARSIPGSLVYFPLMLDLSSFGHTESFSTENTPRKTKEETRLLEES
jgi:hypothetical protein